MPIHEYEMMHGAVLTKLCRNDEPTSLSMIETRDTHWSAYWINATVVLYVKHATNPRKDRRGKLTWHFTFTGSNIGELAEFTRQHQTYLALVCAQHDLQGPMEICLFEPDEVQQCLDLAVSQTQWIAVEAEANKSLRAYGAHNNEERAKIVVSRRRLEDWQVPGR